MTTREGRAAARSAGGSERGGVRVLQYRRRLGRAFLDDGQAMLDGLKDCVAQLPGASHPQALLNQAFRHAHSLKSEASFLGLTDLFEKTHALEEYLAVARSTGLNRIGGVEALVGAVKAVQQAFSESAGEIQRPGGEAGAAAPPGHDSPAASTGPTPGGLQQLSRFERRILREAETRGEKLYRIRCEIVDPEPMLYARIYLVVCNLERLVNVVKTNPPVERVTDALRSFEILCTAETGADTIADSIDVAAIENVRVEERSYELLYRSADGEQDGYRSGLLAGLESVDLSLSTRAYERLCLYTDELHNELEVLQGAMENERRWRNSRLHRKLQTAAAMMGAVERTVSETSEVRLYGVFDGLQALIAQLGRELGKLIRLRTAGGELTVFLPLARILSQLLGHVVRNAADHGLEPPEVRSEIGKPEYGEIRIEALQEDRYLVIRVSDDGRGIDEQAVRERYRRVFGAESPAGLLDVVTAPGFTSRPDSSSFSGRGVGLDTVRHTVETVLGGRIELSTEVGSGTTLSVYFSRGTRLVSVLVASFRGRRFAIPASEIDETFRIDARYLSYDHSGNSHYRHDGENLALFAVAEVGALEELDHSRLYGIVTSLRRRRVVILAEELVSEEVVARDEARHDQVFSQTLGEPVRLLVTLRLQV